MKLLYAQSTGIVSSHDNILVTFVVLVLPQLAARFTEI